MAIHSVPASVAELAELFGGETGAEVDKFARCDWREGPRGMPQLAASANWSPDFDEFSFRRARRLEPGHEP